MDLKLNFAIVPSPFFKSLYMIRRYLRSLPKTVTIIAHDSRVIEMAGEIGLRVIVAHHDHVLDRADRVVIFKDLDSKYAERMENLARQKKILEDMYVCRISLW